MWLWVIPDHWKDDPLGNAWKSRIETPDGDQMLNGAFVNYSVDEPHLSCFEKMSGQKLDLAMRVINFGELHSGRPFPIKEAKLMQRRGSALFLVLEPGAGKRPADVAFPLDEIGRGAYKEELANFSVAALNYKGPVLLTFRPQLGNNASTEQVKAGYQALRRALAGKNAANVTLAWSVNLDDKTSWQNPPPADQFTWVAATAYEQTGLDKLSANIAELKKLGKPIVVEFGSSTTGRAKAEYLKTAVAKFKEWGIKAFVLHNVSQTEGTTFRPWALNEPAVRSAYHDALTGLVDPVNQSLLRENIKMAKGYAEGKAEPIANLNCPAVENKYFNAAEADALEAIHGDIKDALHDIKRGDPHTENSQYVKLAGAYKRLYSFTRDTANLETAMNYLIKASENVDPAVSYDPKIRYVYDYINILFDTADLLNSFDHRKTLQSCQEIMNKLNNNKLRHAQWVRDESIDGFTARIDILTGGALEALNRGLEAAERYAAVAAWSDEEDTRNEIVLKWKSEDRVMNRYLGALAKIRLIYRSLSENDYVKAVKYTWEIMALEETGKEDGFMDLGFKALTLALKTSLLLTANPVTGRPDLAAAKDFFSRALPWWKINGYKDLKKSMGLKDIDLPAGKPELWDVIMKGLSYAELPDDQRLEIDAVRAYCKP